jgi:YbbR-like protein
MKQWSTDDIRLFFKSDRAVLMLCIGIALVFWILNKMSHSARTYKSVTIEYRLPRGKTFTAIPISNLTATIIGSGWDLLGKGKVNIALDMTNDSFQTIGSGRLRQAIARQYNISEDMIHLNVDLIPVYLEDEALKEVPVAPLTHLKFVKGYRLLGEILLQPAKVILKGPKNVLEMISVVYTDTIRGENLKKNVEQTIPIQIPSRVVKCLDATVKARLSIEEFTEKAMFLPLVVKNAPATYKIFPNKIKLSCTVGLSQYNNINPNLFEAEVDLDGVSTESKNNTISVALVKQPAGVQNVQFMPKSVEFYFEK